MARAVLEVEPSIPSVDAGIEVGGKPTAAMGAGATGTGGGAADEAGR
jgi:hypothetical protein